VLGKTLVIKQCLLSTFILGLAIFTPTANAALSDMGGALSVVAIGKDPDNLHGYRASLWYQPKSFIWKNVDVYFAGSAGHWWSEDATRHHSLNIYAIAPVLRFYIAKANLFDAYAELSIGLSYLTRTRFDDRNLGMHFAFQDELGLGATFGKTRNYYATISALHYSNGSMCSMNAGITAPLMLTAGYRFG
jgi:lipid A 3-O-deacylase